MWSVIKSLPSGSEIFLKYINRLQYSYGEKYYSGLISLICIIASAYEPLTVKEIGYLMGEEKPTFKLLAYLSDTKSLFQVERSYRGNLISIGHAHLQSLIVQEHKGKIKKLIREWWARKVNEKFIIIHDGDSYLLAYLQDYLKTYFPHGAPYVDGNPKTDEDPKIFDGVNLANYIQGAEELRAKAQYQYQRERLVRIYSEVLGLPNQLIDHDKWPLLYNHRGILYLEIGEKEKALGDQNQALNLIQEHKVGKNVHQIEALIRNSRGLTLLAMGNVLAAIQEFDHGINLLDQVTKKDLQETEVLGDLYLSRGKAYHQRGNPYNPWFKIQAIRNLKEALKIKEELLGKGLEPDGSLIDTYYYLGQVYLVTKRKGKGVRAFKDALFLAEKLYHNDPAMTKYLSILYEGYGLAHKDHAKALESLTQAIKIRENLSETGRYINLEELTDLYVHRGKKYRKIGERAKALIDLEYACGVKWELYKEGKLSSLKGFSRAYWQNALTHLMNKTFLKALENFLGFLLIAQESYRKMDLSYNPSLLSGLLKKYHIKRDVLRDFGFEEEVDEEDSITKNS